MNPEITQQATSVIVDIVRLSMKGQRALPRERVIKAFHLAHVCHAQEHGDELTAWPIGNILTQQDIAILIDLMHELAENEIIVESKTVVYPLSGANNVSPTPQRGQLSINAAINRIRHLP